MFKFDFSVDTSMDGNTPAHTESREQLHWIPCREIFTPVGSADNIDRRNVRTFTCGDCILSHMPPDNAAQELMKDVKELEHSDLLPAIYEGGLKIWECTRDMIEYLQCSTSNVDFSNKTVLDLGCGAGLIGIFALLKGACVHFQDYNDAVMTSLTIPNVQLNTNEMDESSESCRYFAGDWESFTGLVEDRYDYILTSETIYNPDNHLKIYLVIKNMLKKTGVAFVAAKTYYFGVGGGLRQFENFLKQESILESSVVWKCLQGVKREILYITFKETTAARDKLCTRPYFTYSNK